ncbi:hypothetical protein SAMN04488038_112143 [Solimonas aquatica]|uniref:Uncharacterized protein n=1 Tax=Solimonas aquatica TaxID=489703 RepID=A0A1H9JZ85_9GAMM|nr:hypothetical protein [Solimonas aquatica]SEQ92088.1 hypothetical protein SAMN04488038_112143 [Solimonas aquatica]
MRPAAMLLFAALPVTALAQDWPSCRAIAEDSARLACYDQLAGTAPVADQSLGAEQLPGHSQSEMQEQPLHSRIPGELQGWDAKTRFTLENGQVWQNAGDRPAYFRVRDAAVTIEKSALGGYWLKIDALNLQTRVRRIR